MALTRKLSASEFIDKIVAILNQYHSTKVTIAEKNKSGFLIESQTDNESDNEVLWIKNKLFIPLFGELLNAQSILKIFKYPLFINNKGIANFIDSHTQEQLDEIFTKLIEDINYWNDFKSLEAAQKIAAEAKEEVKIIIDEIVEKIIADTMEIVKEVKKVEKINWMTSALPNTYYLEIFSYLTVTDLFSNRRISKNFQEKSDLRFSEGVWVFFPVLGANYHFGRKNVISFDAINNALKTYFYNHRIVEQRLVCDEESKFQNNFLQLSSEKVEYQLEEFGIAKLSVKGSVIENKLMPVIESSKIRTDMDSYINFKPPFTPGTIKLISFTYENVKYNAPLERRSVPLSVFHSKSHATSEQSPDTKTVNADTPIEQLSESTTVSEDKIVFDFGKQQNGLRLFDNSQHHVTIEQLSAEVKIVNADTPIELPLSTAVNDDRNQTIFEKQQTRISLFNSKFHASSEELSSESDYFNSFNLPLVLEETATAAVKKAYLLALANDKYLAESTMAKDLKDIYAIASIIFNIRVNYNNKMPSSFDAGFHEFRDPNKGIIKDLEQGVKAVFDLYPDKPIEDAIDYLKQIVDHKVIAGTSTCFYDFDSDLSFQLGQAAAEILQISYKVGERISNTINSCRLG